MQFYRKLSTLRKEAGLSQEQLAEKAGVSRQTIFKWESGLASPSMENILTLSRLFCVSADELIGNEAFAARESEESLGKEDARTPQNTSDQEDERGAFTAEQSGEKKDSFLCKKAGIQNRVPSYLRTYNKKKPLAFTDFYTV